MIGKITVTTCSYIGNTNDLTNPVIDRLLSEILAGSVHVLSHEPPCQKGGQTEYRLMDGTKVKVDTYVMDDGNLFSDYWLVPRAEAQPHPTDAPGRAGRDARE